MHRKFIHLFLLFAFLLVPLESYADNAESNARKAAKEELYSFLTAMPLQDLRNHGFVTKEETEKAALGYGFEIFTISPEDIISDNLRDVREVISSTNMWMFIVTVDDRPKTLVTVGLVDGQWRLYAFGPSQKATRLNEVLAAWPPAAGYSHRYVEIRQAQANFVQVYHGNKEIGFIPNETLLGYINGKMPDKYDPFEFVVPNKILPNIRPAVKTNIEAWKSRGKGGLR